MLNLLAMKRPRSERGEPLLSWLCGVPAITIGVGAIWILLSQLGEEPIGSETFFRSESVGVTERRLTGEAVGASTVNRSIPSMQFLGMVTLGGCVAGVGIFASRLRSPDCKTVVSAIGLIACVLAFVVAWIFFAVAAST
jgi:hypothetical protein